MEANLDHPLAVSYQLQGKLCNSLPHHIPTHDYVTSFTNGFRNNSGYEDNLVCPMNLSRNSRNSQNIVNGCHDDSGYCSINMGTRLSYTSSSSSSRSSNGASYYQGMNPIAYSCDDTMPYSVVNIVPDSLPVQPSAINQPRSMNHLPSLAPIHYYATSGKTHLHHVSEVEDIDSMNVSQ